MTEPATAPARTPDRRAERSRQAILAATLQLLDHDGGDVGALTVEAVAARSGVAKTTIYRHWRDKWELALDAVMIDTLPQFDEPADAGDTRKELLTFVNSVVKMLAATPCGPAMQGPVSQIATDPELARVYRDQVVQPGSRLPPAFLTVARWSADSPSASAAARSSHRVITTRSPLHRRTAHHRSRRGGGTSAKTRSARSPHTQVRVTHPVRSSRSVLSTVSSEYLRCFHVVFGACLRGLCRAALDR
jgi:AcrR family transcriptional regulator